MSVSSKGYTSSFRGDQNPAAYAQVLGSNFGTLPTPGGPVDTELGLAAYYALLAYSGITNTGNSVITAGNIGSSPTASITGFPPGVIAPPNAIDNADAGAARTAGEAAYTYYAGLTPTQTGLSNLSTNNGGGGAGVYLPGVYSGGALSMPTGITLNGAGLYVFIASSTVNLASGQSVTLENGATADNVVWVVGSSLTTVATSNMVGNILAYASITLGGGTLIGRALAVGGGDGAVTIAAATTVTVPVGVPGTTGIQNPLPLIPAESTADYLFVIPNMGSQWKVQKSVDYDRPQGLIEPAGIAIDNVDCISPEYPGVSTAVTASYAVSSYFVMNGYLFQATTGGTTATTFIGFNAFNLTKGATTTDGTVVWTSHGKAVLVRARFANYSTTPATPVAQEYDFWEK
jgi:hypothetical protein